ncbi:MAG TPA: MarR family transcriptional regulator [Xanthobacteraceae bacterium]|nr:MarR family transcriptional regulator [Xanthobacteraceae bacterium]
MSRPPKRENRRKLSDHTAYWLHRLSRSVLARFDGRLSELGITVAQFMVMLVIYNDNGTTQQNLSKYIDVDKGSITRIIDRLVAKRQVVRRAIQGDRRAVRLELTKDGEKVMKNLLKIADDEDNAWLSALSVTEITELKRLLGTLLTAQGIAYPNDWLTRVGRL